MMPTLGAPELIIILVIIILIFGVGKLPEVGQALGKGIREFRGAADADEDDQAPAKPAAPAAPVAPAAPAPAPVAVEAPRPATAVEAPRPAPVVVAAPAAPAVTYIAVTGDTPEKVATSHGVTVEELLAANGWSRKDRSLDEGDRVLIPSKSTPA
jgi:sec-independent protein translocase protein TatA